MAKIGGFIGTVAAGAALVAAAAGGTGAYFTDSKAGEMKASTGQLKLNTTETNLSFADLMPGTSKTNSLDYNVVTTGPSDVWLVFDPADASYQKFTGAKLNALAPKGGLGRYGHSAVSNNTGGPLFQSYNLAHAPVDRSPRQSVQSMSMGTVGAPSRPSALKTHPRGAECRRRS